MVATAKAGVAQASSPQSWGLIAHQTQYRIRYVIPALAEPSHIDKLQVCIESLPFVQQVRVNLAARSIVVEYDGVSSGDAQSAISDCIQRVIFDVKSDAIVGADWDWSSKGDVPLMLGQMVGYEVVHRNSERIRFKIPRLAEDTEYSHRLEQWLTSLDFVTEFRLNRWARSISITVKPQPHQPIAHLEQFLIDIVQQAAHSEPPEIHLGHDTSKEINPWERLGLPVASMVLGVGALLDLPLLTVFTAGVIFVATAPVFQRAFQALRDDRQFTIDFLDGLAISLHTAQSSFFPAAFMLSLIEGGEVIRDMTARSSERASLDLLDSLSSYALVERNGQEVKISVKDVVKGDRVIVYPGDQIPVDGYVLRGTGLIDQCKLTGESVPVMRTEGDEVFASTLVVDGQLCILVERTGNNTRAGVIVSLMQSAPIHDTRMENYAAKVANQLVVPTLFLAATVGILSADLNRCIALLTLDLGTGIRLSVPTTILSALTYAARNGVFIRSGRAIEILAKVDTIVFDKTGTLTQGHAGVVGIMLMQPGVTEHELLALAATAEQGLTHPVAEAIVRHARTLNLPLGECDAWDYCVGLGVVSSIQGRSVLVGSHRLMMRESVNLDTFNQRYANLKTGGQSIVYIAVDGVLVGTIFYSDPARPESQSVIQDLQDQHISTYMLSGDVTSVAHAVAQELGIHADCVYAEAFPESKVEVVKALHDSGKTVAFCGDGINDSAALAYADVSISFAGATDIARETADIVLMENDLRSLLHAIKIAKQAIQIIEQNITLVAVPNLSAVVAGVLFALDPILAIIINNGSAILAEVNGLRPLLGPEGITPLSLSLDAVALNDQASQELSGSEVLISAPVQIALSSLPLKQPELDDSALSLTLTQAALAKRLNSTERTLSRHKLKPEFGEWSRSRDPDGMAWHYHSASKSFQVIEQRQAQSTNAQHIKRATRGNKIQSVVDVAI